MAAQQIDELQLKIGSDASKAIRQLNNLSAALNQVAQSAGQIQGLSGSNISSLMSSISQLANAGSKAKTSAKGIADLTTAVTGFMQAMSNAPAINANVAQTIVGLGNLAQAGAKTGRVLNNLSSGGGGDKAFFGMMKNSANTTVNAFKKLGSAAIDLGGRGASSLGNFLGKLGLIPGYTANVNRMAISFGNLLRAVLPFYGLSGVFNWLKDAVMTGASIVEVENVVDTMFGDLRNGYENISGYIYKWAESTIDAFGVSELAARQYAGRLMAMFNSSGFDLTEGMRDSAAKMSMDLIERSGDIASFYDITVDEAMTKIQAGLAGMNRPLRSLGVNLSVANLEAFALSKGITQSWQSMDQATQMALRYEYIMNATKYAMGDFSRTANTFSNQVRLLSLNFQVLGATIGQGLISAIAPVISYLNLLIRRLIQAASAFRTFMFTVFGKAIGAAKGVVSDLAEYAGDASDSLGGIGDSGGGLGGAAKSAKELRKQLSVLPFDELNQLAKDTSTAGSGGGGGGGGGGGLGGFEDLFGESLLDATDLDGSDLADAINAWGLKLKDAFENGAWIKLGKTLADGLNDGFQYVYDLLSWDNWEPKVMGFVDPFSTTINSMMFHIDWDLIGRTFGEGLNTITYALDYFITSFDFKSYGTYFATGMNGFLDEWDAAAFGKLIADKFMIAWKVFSGLVHTFDFGLLGTRLKTAAIEAIDSIDWEDVGDSLGTFLTGLGTTLKTMFTNDEDGSLRESIRNGFSSFLRGFFNTFDAGEIRDGLIEAGHTIIGGLADALIENRDSIADSFKFIFENIPWDTVLLAASGIFATKFASMFIGTALQGAIFGHFSGLSGVGAAGAAGMAGTAGAAGASTGLSALASGGIGLGALFGAMKLGEFGSEWYARAKGATPVSTYARDRQMFSNDTDADTNYDVGSKEENRSVKVTKTYDAVSTPRFVNLFDKFADLGPYDVDKGYDATENDRFLADYKKFTDKGPYNVTKDYKGTESGGFVDKFNKYTYVTNRDVNKDYSGSESNNFSGLLKDYKFVDPMPVTKTFKGQAEGNYNQLVSDYKNLPTQKDLYIKLKKANSSVTWTGIVKGQLKHAIGELTGSIEWNAQGGMFLGPTVMQGFGEAGPEAALPLRNKRSMSMIANAITNAGGVSNIDPNAIGYAVARAIAPYITDMINRPVDVHATLYTENNEVLARAVNRGQRSIDKRYNPVSQFSYG